MNNLKLDKTFVQKIKYFKNPGLAFNWSRTERGNAQDFDHNTIMVPILFIQSFEHLLISIVNFYFIFQIICKSPG